MSCSRLQKLKILESILYRNVFDGSKTGQDLEDAINALWNMRITIQKAVQTPKN